jgi:hypothetical protein
MQLGNDIAQGCDIQFIGIESIPDVTGQGKGGSVIFSEEMRPM